MKNLSTAIVAILITCVLVAYMITFQVRYDEVAVLTTFNKVGDSSLKTDAGLYWKAPWPVQKVYSYSRKLHILEDQLEQVQTADDISIIVRTYVGWKITNPHAFFTSVRSVPEAEDRLLRLMFGLKGVMTTYRFDEIVNNDPKKIKLAEIEQEAKKYLVSKLENFNYGIEITEVGIRRLVLPQKTTEKVFERMKAAREAKAEKARAEGDAEAATIRSEAESARERILAFATRRAEAIRAQGDREAASYYSAFAEDEDFAIFLRRLQALKAMLPHNTTFIIDSKDLATLEMLSTEPVVAPTSK